jgi:hypothetical protein
VLTFAVGPVASAELGPGALPEAARAAYAKALTCYDDLHFRCALEQVKKAIGIAPASPTPELRAAVVELYTLLAQTLVALDRRAEAVAAFRRVLDLAPAYAPAAGTSPKIRQAFLEARAAWERARPLPSPPPPRRIDPPPPPPVVATSAPVERVVVTRVEVPPRTPLFLSADFAYSLLFGRDAEAFRSGPSGVFALGYALGERWSVAIETMYGRFAPASGLSPGLELLCVAAQLRARVPLSDRVDFVAGASAGLSAFGVRGLTEAGGAALLARLEISVRLAQTLHLSLGASPGVIASPSAGSSFFLPLRGGVAFKF